MDDSASGSGGAVEGPSLEPLPADWCRSDRRAPTSTGFARPLLLASGRAFAVPQARSGRRATACIALAAALVSACATGKPSSPSGASGGSAPGGQWQRIDSASTRSEAIRYFGFIDVTQDEEGESQYFEAGFARFDETAPLSVLLDSFRQPDADSCDYRQQERGDSTPLEFADELELPGHPYEFVSAGSPLDVTVGSRRYASIPRTSSSPEDEVQYETDVGSLPLSWGGLRLGDALLRTRGLRIASAGDVFPAFSGIEVPPVGPVTRFRTGKRQRIGSDTRIRWRKGRDADDPDVRVQIEAGGGGRAVFCAVTDDGEFRLPEAVRARLLDASIPGPSAYRDAVRFYLGGDALLIVSQSSYY